MPRRRRPAAAALAVPLAALALVAGCSNAPEDGSTAQPSQSASASPSPSGEPATTPAPDPTPTADPDPQPDPANPDPLPELTPPGARIALGEPITVRTRIGVLDESAGWAVLRNTVTEIVEGDHSYIERMSDAEEYQGGRVYYVRGQVEVVALHGRGIGGMVGGAITGVQSDNTLAAGVFSVGEGAPDCKGNFIISPAHLGDVEESCTVALALPGTEITAAAYYSDGVLSDEPSDDPYLHDPVVWLP